MVSNVNADNNDVMQFIVNSMRGTSAANAGQNIGAANASGSSSATKSDFLSCLENNFSKLDSDKNGQISKDELTNYVKNQKPMGPPPGLNIENSDSTNSTQRSKFSDTLSSVVDSLDTNKDGSLSMDELSSAQNSSSQTANNSSSQSSSSNSTDALATAWKKLSSSDTAKEIFQKLQHKLSDVYKNNGSLQGLMSSASSVKV